MTLVPELSVITVGTADPSLVGAAPIMLAIDRGYVQDAGFASAAVMVVEEPLPGLMNGQLTMAILGTHEVADALSAGLDLRIVAAYQDLTDPVVTQQRLLVTAAETLARYPGTVAAATVAHIRARHQADLWIVVEGHPFIALVDLRDAIAERGRPVVEAIEAAPGGCVLPARRRGPRVLRDRRADARLPGHQ